MRLKVSSVWKTRSDCESSSEMPAENIFCGTLGSCIASSTMHLISPRPFKLSMASASSVISGTLSTLYGGWFSVMCAAKLLVSNLMCFGTFPTAGALTASTGMGFTSGVVPGIMRRKLLFLKPYVTPASEVRIVSHEDRHRRRPCRLRAERKDQGPPRTAGPRSRRRRDRLDRLGRLSRFRQESGRECGREEGGFRGPGLRLG